MKRRSFLKSGLVFTGLIWVPRKSLAQLNISSPFFVAGTLKPAAGGGASCNTVRDSVSGAFDDVKSTSGFYTYLATQFTAAGTYTICKARLEIGRQGAALSGTVQVKLYSNSSNNPGSLVGTGSDTVDASIVSDTPGYITFSNMSASLTSSTIYWVVIQCSAVFTSLIWVGDTGTTLNRASTDGSSWDNIAGLDCHFELSSS